MAKKGLRYCEFYGAVDFLKKKIPPPHPICVQRVLLKEDHGRCHFNGDRFTIVVDRRLSEEMAIETLLHEWAHAISWNSYKPHGPKWGRAYSRVYRTYLGVD